MTKIKLIESLIFAQHKTYDHSENQIYLLAL